MATMGKQAMSSDDHKAMIHDNDEVFDKVELVYRRMFNMGYRAERALLIMYYPGHMTQDDIAIVRGISQQHVSRRLNAARESFCYYWLKLNQNQ